MEIKIVVVKLDIHDDKDKQKALKAVSSLTGINSVVVNMKESKITVTGEVDPVAVVGKLRKYWNNAQIVTVGAPPPPPKDDKKDGDKKDGDKKDGKEQPPPYNPFPYPYPYPYPHSYPPRAPMYYSVQTIDENPNGCVIC